MNQADDGKLVPQVTVTASSASSITYLLSVQLQGDAQSVYSLFGTPDAPILLPPAFQVAPPFGSDVGGTPPLFWPYHPAAQWDSWLTVGVPDGTATGAVAALDY